MNIFINHALKELTDQQVRFAPPPRRQEQLGRTEKLLAEIEATKEYPYQYICYRITDYRPEAYPELVISGADLKHDLVLFIAELNLSLAIEQNEPMLTLDEVSKKLNVSTKTISRWRTRGLIPHAVLANGKRYLGFPESVVDRFVSLNPDRVERGSRFSQLTDDEKEEILRRAQRLSRLASGTLTEISRRIARRMGRSPETVRYTIKNFDREHPEQALFPHVTGPLDDQAKQTIFNMYRRKVPVESLAKRFGRTRTSMYRVINEIRAERLLGQALDYIYHPSFDDAALAGEILAAMPNAAEYAAQRTSMRAPKDAPPELAALYEVPLLKREQEAHLFRKMNYLKYRASQMRAKLDPAHARIQEIREIEDLQEQASALKEQLINCNMRLVVSIAKRHSAQTDNLWELMSDGNMSLIRAVEKFDYSRGNKFSTYASWAIMKNFARSIPEEQHRRERFLTGHDDLFEAAPDTRTNEQEVVQGHEQAAHRVNRLLEHLDPRERDIIRMRAGLDNSEGMTLEEIGQRLGITKERVRQLNVRIMNKLRNLAAREQDLDLR